MNFKQNFVSYELAKKVIDAGFDWECCMHYWNLDEEQELGHVEDEFNEPCTRTPNQIKDYSANYCIAAPMYQQVVDWLRENHGVIIKLSDDYEDGSFEFNCRTTHLEHWNLSFYRKEVGYYKAFDTILNECLDMATDLNLFKTNYES